MWNEPVSDKCSWKCSFQENFETTAVYQLLTNSLSPVYRAGSTLRVDGTGDENQRAWGRIWIDDGNRFKYRLGSLLAGTFLVLASEQCVRSGAAQDADAGAGNGCSTSASGHLAK